MPFQKEMKQQSNKMEQEAKARTEQLGSRVKEKKLIKKIFKERTKSRQPVMKNYLNYLLYKIENPKKQ